MGASSYISIIARLLLSAVGMATVIFFKLAPELGLPIDPEMDVRIVQVEWSQVKPWVSFLFLFLFLLFSVCALALPHPSLMPLSPWLLDLRKRFVNQTTPNKRLY